MNLLVTGGLGFLGSILSRHFVRKGHKVHIIDDGSHALVESVPGTTLDRHFVDRHALDWIDSPDVAIHAAALSTVAGCQREPLRAVERNCVDAGYFLEKLAEKFPKVKVVYTSSCAVYNSTAFGIQEDFGVAPVSVYAMTKHLVEEQLRVLAKDGLRSVCLRFSNIIGAAYGIVEGARGEDRLIPSLFRAARTRLPFVKNSDTVRDYLHVMDAVAAVEMAIAAMTSSKAIGRGEPYNICSGMPYTISHVIETVQWNINRKIKVVDGPPRKGDVWQTAPSNKKAEEVLKWTPARSLERGVKDAWKAYA